jgi:two-component system cell cycle sensor histidine kinase/response regulator CckA
MPARTLPLDALDRLPIVIFRLDLDLRLGYVSRALATDMGFPPEAVFGKTLFEIGHTPENAAFQVEQYRSVIRTGNPAHFEWSIDFPTGTRWFQNDAVPEFDDEGRVSGVIGYASEITAVKQAQIEEQSREARMYEFLTQSPFGAWLKDAEGRYVFVNRALEESLKIKSEEWVGKTDSDVFPLVTASAVRANDREVLATGRFRQFTEHAPGPDGDERVWMTMKFPFRDRAGKPHVAGIGIDLTEVERERAERARIAAFADLQRERSAMEAQLLKSQKLESLGVLAGGIAHDFNNLLTSVLGYASLLRMQLPPNTASQDYLKQIDRAGSRAAELCQQMLAYSGRGRFVVEPIALNSLVQEMGQLLGTVISKKSILKFNLAAELPTILGDATQVRQVVMNLITNASDAIGERSGVITLTTSIIDADAKYLGALDLLRQLAPGRFVYLEVSDSGSGMSEETISRIFEPFFTTKFTGRGLGLAAVQGILRGHHGAIKVYSQPGKGTTFKVLFPAGDGVALPSVRGEAISAPFGRERLILVVDDEEDIRIFARKALEATGFQVELATDGRDALQQFRAFGDRIAVVILDLTMPHLGGEATFRELRQLRPDVKVILTSGFNQEEATVGFAGKGLAGFLRKPFVTQELYGLVHSVVGE